jgi:hypothetical protein
LTLLPPCGNPTDVVVATRVQARRRRSRLHSATAVAVAALLVVANLVAHWHQATVVHARCEHGELVHAEGLAEIGGHARAEASADAAPVGGDAPVAVAVVRSRAAAPASDEHDHCELCPLTREPLRLGAAVVVAAPAPEVVAPARPSASHAAARTIDRVRFAPKTSPPFET